MQRKAGRSSTARPRLSGGATRASPGKRRRSVKIALLGCLVRCWGEGWHPRTHARLSPKLSALRRVSTQRRFLAVFPVAAATVHNLPSIYSRRTGWMKGQARCMDHNDTRAWPVAGIGCRVCAISPCPKPAPDSNYNVAFNLNCTGNAIYPGCEKHFSLPPPLTLPSPRRAVAGALARQPSHKHNASMHPRVFLSHIASQPVPGAFPPVFPRIGPPSHQKPDKRRNPGPPC